MPDYRSSEVLWSKVIIARGGSRNFLLGGSKLWFRKDCWTFLRQITSPPHPLLPVAVARMQEPIIDWLLTHVIIPLPVTVYLNHWTEKWISLKFAHVQTKSKICTKVVNAKFAHPIAPLCEGVCRFGICHLCVDFTLSSHTFAHEQI